MEELLRLDTEVLLAVNGLRNSLLDTFFWNVSSKFIWIGLYGVMVFLLWQRYGKRSLWLLLSVILAFALSDFISHELKHLICRPRPSRDETIGQLLHIVNNYRGGKYGFPSSHAADTFSVALLLSLIWRDRRTTLPLMLWVVLNCYSRMYLGVHYPLDIMGGVLTGSIISATIYVILRKTDILKEGDKQVAPPWLEYMPLFVVSLTLLICLFP